MKVKISKFGLKWNVEIIEGHQSFFLRYEGTKAECMWMTKMFRSALNKHDKNILKKAKGIKLK